jgi:hypothetical protein
MHRVSVCALVIATVVAGVGAFGRTHVRPVAARAVENDRTLDGLASLCSKRVATAVVETTNVNLIVNDAHTTQGTNRGCVAAQNEPSIAVNPTDSTNLIAGANDFRLCCDFDGTNNSTGWAYYSNDGGATWSNVLLPGLTRGTGGSGRFARFDVAEDPALAFAADGTAYYTNIVFSTSGAASGIAVSTSKDGGESWSPPHLVTYTNDRAIFNDKAWVAAGEHGEVAITWTRFHSNSFAGDSVVKGAISRDGGRTWSRPILLSDRRHLHSWGAVPVWAADGTLYTVFQTSRVAGHSSDAISVSLLRPRAPLVERDVARVYDDTNCFAINGYLRPTLSGESFRVSSLPSASIDPQTQTVAVAWADGQRGCKPGRFRGTTDAQVKLLFVHGTHASQPRIITSGADKALPAVAYRDGEVVVGYYTRSFAPADCRYRGSRVCIDYAYSTSTDGFTAEHRLSDGSSNPFEQFDGAFIGDYSAVVLGPDGAARAVWTDSRGGDQNIYTQAFAP